MNYFVLTCYNAGVNKTRLEYFAQFAGIATTVIEWAALLIYYLQVPLYFGGQYPISYFATLPQTKIVFSVCYTVAAICFWIFVRHHVSKHYRVPIKIFGISMALLIGVALFPFDPNNAFSNAVHSILAYGSGLTFLAGVVVMAVHADDRFFTRVSMIAAVLSTGLTIAFAAIPPGSDLLFAFEAGSWLVWQVWTIWVTYYIYRNKPNTDSAPQK